MRSSFWAHPQRGQHRACDRDSVATPWFPASQRLHLSPLMVSIQHLLEIFFPEQHRASCLSRPVRTAILTDNFLATTSSLHTSGTTTSERQAPLERPFSPTPPPFSSNVSSSVRQSAPSSQAPDLMTRNTFETRQAFRDIFFLCFT